jgi:hypothetical protein
VHRRPVTGKATLVLAAVAVCLAAGAPLCGAPPGPPDGEEIAPRIRGRTFPSVFQAWSPAEGLKGESRLQVMARHDLVFLGVGAFGLRWNRRPVGLATGIELSSIEGGRAIRRQLLDLNPHIVLLAEIRYRDAHRGFLPDDHPFWRRKDGKRVAGWDEGGYFQLDFSNPDYRAHVARRAGAVVATGVVDGVMLDWWRDDEDRLALVRAVREAVGPDALILVNANDRRVPESDPYVNGLFMECYRSQTAEDWARIAETLRWAESHLRRPRINCLETWFHRSRQDLHLMRATTALALTHSDGYCLFSDPNPLPTPDHRHDWYPFWEKGLGRPTGPGHERDDGVVVRPFTRGWAAYNPMGGGEATLTFPEAVTSRATGRRGRTHRLAPSDGDIFLRTPGD